MECRESWSGRPNEASKNAASIKQKAFSVNGDNEHRTLDLLHALNRALCCIRNQFMVT